LSASGGLGKKTIYGWTLTNYNCPPKKINKIRRSIALSNKLCFLYWSKTISSIRRDFHANYNTLKSIEEI
jgi:hypothetical protein